MLPIAYIRSQIAFEIEETLKFSGLSNNRVDKRIRKKIVDVMTNRTYYSLEFKHGKIRVYGPRFIIINGEKYKSVYEAQSKLCSFIR
jgi:hypothetical protein